MYGEHEEDKMIRKENALRNVEYHKVMFPGTGELEMCVATFWECKFKYRDCNKLIGSYPHIQFTYMSSNLV